MLIEPTKRKRREKVRAELTLLRLLLVQLRSDLSLCSPRYKSPHVATAKALILARVHLQRIGYKKLDQKFWVRQIAIRVRGSRCRQVGSQVHRGDH